MLNGFWDRPGLSNAVLLLGSRQDSSSEDTDVLLILIEANCNPHKNNKNGNNAYSNILGGHKHYSSLWKEIHRERQMQLFKIQILLYFCVTQFLTEANYHIMWENIEHVGT